MAIFSDIEVHDEFREMLQRLGTIEGNNAVGRHELDVLRNVLAFSMARLRKPRADESTNDNRANPGSGACNAASLKCEQ
ncbi:hypothetical protein [Phyllobacterium sophorae]|uniref:Uncharacterized protein n=1 Tax=Phyllobacterium sophorae TaxID=1520277 RepID=A0A2P7BFH2_9HYPH|nr:hypothetical protein [Phyllobacterium sophorae]PSH65179.1 hypothetical protein CU103_09160 [Phyllobacterium sophorae]